MSQNHQKFQKQIINKQEYRKTSKMLKKRKKPGENRQKYRKTIKNLKTGKKQTKISKNRHRKIFKTAKKTW